MPPHGRSLRFSFKGPELVQSYAKETLRNVSLSGPVLVDFLNRIPEFVATLESHSPSPKRRRTNNNNVVATLSDSPELDEVMGKVTFILELVDNSVLEDHPELAAGLFKSLAALHHLKTRIQSSLGYLLSLVLGSLLAIVNKAKKSSSRLLTLLLSVLTWSLTVLEAPRALKYRIPLCSWYLVLLLLLLNRCFTASCQSSHSWDPVCSRKTMTIRLWSLIRQSTKLYPFLFESLRNQKARYRCWNFRTSSQLYGRLRTHPISSTSASVPSIGYQTWREGLLIRSLGHACKPSWSRQECFCLDDLPGF